MANVNALYIYPNNFTFKLQSANTIKVSSSINLPCDEEDHSQCMSRIATILQSGLP